jgi:hypothetical protein
MAVSAVEVPSTAVAVAMISDPGWAMTVLSDWADLTPDDKLDAWADEVASNLTISHAHAVAAMRALTVALAYRLRLEEQRVQRWYQGESA